MVLENSVEEFTARFRADAAEGVLYPGVEGGPLLEFESGATVLYLFDRTGPYAARPGPARVVVHAVARELEVTEGSEEEGEHLHLVGVSSAEGLGRVLRVERDVLVVRARVPIVLGSFERLPNVQVGALVRFTTWPPFHGFFI